VGIRRWFSNLMGPSDVDAPERNVDALEADRKTGLLGGGSMREYERLGEQDDG